MNKQVQTRCSEIKFSITVTWPQADVDVVIAERTMFHKTPHEIAGRTPKSDSVDRFINAVMDDKIFERYGLNCTASNGFIMGCCSVEFTLEDMSKLEQLPQLIELAKKRVKQLRRRHVRYYKTGKTMESHIDIYAV